MKANFMGLLISAIIHLGLFTWVFYSFSESQLPQKIEKSVALRLMMFQPAQKQAVVQQAVEQQDFKIPAKPSIKSKAKPKLIKKAIRPKKKQVENKVSKKNKIKTPAKKIQKENNLNEKTQEPIREKINNKVVVQTKNEATIEQRYKIRLRELIAKQKKYPPRAKRQGDEGSVLVSFLIHASGSISNIVIKRSSGSDSLDQNAINTIKRVSDKHPFPAGIKPKHFQLSLSLVYRLH